VISRRFSGDKPNNERLWGGPVRVTYVIWSLERGGAERVVFNLAKFANRASFSPSVLCLNHKGALAAGLQEAGVRVTALGKRPGFDLAVIPELMGEIRASRPHILSTHLWSSDFWGRIAGLLCRVPVIVATDHNVRHSYRLHHHLANYLLGMFTDAIVGVSGAVAQACRRRLPGLGGKIVRINNGIAVEEFECGDAGGIRAELGMSSDDPLVVAVGRLVPQKGVEYLLRAAPIVLGCFPSTRFLVVGEGPLRPRLEKEARRKGIGSSFMFTGARHDMRNVLCSADVFVLSSFTEGLPLSVLEAMAARRPIVATDLPGIAEAVRHGQEALLVAPKRTKALADAVIRLLRDRELAARLAENAHRRVRQEFGVQRMISETERLYTRLLQRCRKGGSYR